MDSSGNGEVYRKKASQQDVGGLVGDQPSLAVQLKNSTAHRRTSCLTGEKFRTSRKTKLFSFLL
jgi:hypothetical protein